MPVIRGERVTLEPLAEHHVDALRRILATPAVRAWWGDEAATPGWPFTDDASAVRFAIVVDGAVRGMVQYAEEREARYRHASIDIFVDPAVHNRGHGRDALGAVVRHLLDERGHHRLVIDPAAGNAAAVRCYRAVGFRPVGVMRRYERDVEGDAWHDGLLMELVAGLDSVPVPPDANDGPSPDH